MSTSPAGGAGAGAGGSAGGAGGSAGGGARRAARYARRSLRLSAAERHRQLQEVAVELFAHRGFRSTTMEEVADAAGVSKPLVYQHFGSKRALYLEVLSQVAADLFDDVIGATAAASGPREQVELALSAYFGLVVSRESAFRLLFGRESGGEEELAATIRRGEDAIAEAVSALLAEAVRGPEHRRVLAYCLVGMAEGVSRQWIVRREAGPPLEPEAAAAEAALLARWVGTMAWSGLRGVPLD